MYAIRSYYANVVEVSIPMHLDGCAIHSGLVMEGATQLIFQGNGQGDNWNGLYARSLVETFGSRWKSRPDQIPYTTKAMLFMGTYMRNKYHGKYHAKSQNLRLALIDAYNKTLEDVDMIVMPTIPHTADKLPAKESQLEDIIDASNMLQNTMPFDVSGHPAFSIPCGMLNGLPVGMMLVGKLMDDATLITAAENFAKSFDWKTNTAR